MTNASRKDVLIVDDDESVRDLLHVALTRSGLACDTAADGELAVECLAATDYEVVLLDLAMPRLDGAGVLTRLHAMPKRNAVRPIVLVMTGSVEREPVVQFADAVQVVIRKPLNVSDVGELVHGCIAARNGRPVISPVDRISAAN
jgi:CheY-like chemotaxis protein